MQNFIPRISPLLTDQYQLVMASGYYAQDKAEQEAVFYLYFRTSPFHSDYAVCCGLERVIHFITNYHFTSDEIKYLSTLTNHYHQPLFAADFLAYLSKLKITCDIDAIEEGRLVFPEEPLIRVRGPLLQCQLLETTLINLTSFACLIATKAANISEIVPNDPIIEFGLRRAQGPDGGLTASRAAFIGGCEGTSNVLAGYVYNIPVRGTMAHSWILAFPDELSAFRAFVGTVKGNSVLLVDTFSTLSGVHNAIIVGKELRRQGQTLAGIRLDSGDQLSLSQMARKMLDEAGFRDTKILSSGDLTAEKIQWLKQNGAKIDMWGVGTRLATAYDQPALDMIYKLSMIKENGQWQRKLKISDQPEKISTPGILQVKRYFQGDTLHDTIYDLELGCENTQTGEELLQPIFRRGQLCYQAPAITEIRRRCQKEVKMLRQCKKPPQVKLDPRLIEMKKKLINALAGGSP